MHRVQPAPLGSTVPFGRLAAGGDGGGKGGTARSLPSGPRSPLAPAPCGPLAVSATPGPWADGGLGNSAAAHLLHLFGEPWAAGPGVRWREVPVHGAEQLLGLLVGPVGVEDKCEQAQPRQEEREVGPVQAACQAVPVPEAHPPHVVGQDHAAVEHVDHQPLVQLPQQGVGPAGLRASGGRCQCPIATPAPWGCHSGLEGSAPATGRLTPAPPSPLPPALLDALLPGAKVNLVFNATSVFLFNPESVHLG